MYHYSIVSKLDMTSLWFSVCQSRFPSGKTLIDQLNKISWLTVQETQKISKNAAMVHSFFGFVSFSHVQWQKFRGMWAVEWLHLVYALQLTNLWVFNWWASWSNLCVAALLPALSLKKNISGLWNSAAGFISMSMQIPISLDFALSLNRGGAKFLIEIGGIEKRDLVRTII